MHSYLISHLILQYMVTKFKFIKQNYNKLQTNFPHNQPSEGHLIKLHY